MSSKLDVYMMALIPPVALLVASAVEARWMRAANMTTLAVLALAGAAGLAIPVSRIEGPERALASSLEVRALFAVLLVAAVVGIVIAMRGALASTIALGFVPLAALAYVAIVMMPAVNEFASPRPLVREIVGQHVAAESVALYGCPHLWTRDMPRELEHVRYVSQSTIAAARPEVVITSRAHAGDIAPYLAGFRRTGSLRMIGKWFDVYRR
jgi:hypothetical protein